MAKKKTTKNVETAPIVEVIPQEDVVHPILVNKVGKYQFEIQTGSSVEVKITDITTNLVKKTISYSGLEELKKDEQILPYLNGYEVDKFFNTFVYKQ